jgi:uncharacterized membrane protein YhaH (DUF805 family)
LRKASIVRGRFPTGVATLAYTFGTWLAAAAVVVWIFVWLLVAVLVVRRRDLGFGGKLLWLVVILVVPFIGLFVYFLWDASRPGRA